MFIATAALLFAALNCNPEQANVNHSGHVTEIEYYAVIKKEAKVTWNMFITSH